MHPDIHSLRQDMHAHIHARVARSIESARIELLDRANERETQSLIGRLDTLDGLLKRLPELQRRALMFAFTSELDMLAFHFSLEAAQLVDRPNLERDAAWGDQAASQASLGRLRALLGV